MITVKLDGGLGNQMFQYATAKSLATSSGTSLALDINVFDTCSLRELEINKYNIDARIVNKNSIFRRVIKKLKLGEVSKYFFFEKTLEYDKSINTLGDSTYLEGYFQCEMYFKNIKNALVQEFTLKGCLSEYTVKVASDILNVGMSVSLHVRRGDYASDANTNSVHGTCDLTYYKEAINMISERFKDVQYFIFSDDISWVKKNINVSNAFYVDSQEERVPHEDLYLMSLCNHNIIANSSFSWWGAWLNTNPTKVVIAPKKWFNVNIKYNIVPDDWLSL
jgi:hypothetical protein